MRILYVGTLPPHPGGAAISCTQILEGLAMRGHSITAVAPVTPETLEGATAFDRGHPDLAVIRYTVQFYDHGSAAIQAGEYRDAVNDQLRRVVSRAIVDSKPNVMLTGKETFAWTAPGLARAHGVPVVQRLAGTVTHGLLEGAYPEPLLRELHAKLADIDHLVTPSQYFGAAVPRLGLDRVRVVPTAIDVACFHPAPRDAELAARYGIGPAEAVAAHVSNLKAVKRPLDVVESAALALREEPRLVYLIVGDGALRADMERAAREFRIADRMRFVGWRPYDEMPAHVRLADMVLMPSASEALSRAYVETQACGRVLIASDISAAREVVVEGETGLLFPKGDVHALAAATLRAARDPALRADIGRRARQQAEKHSVVDAVAAYERLLCEVARAGPGKGGDA